MPDPRVTVVAAPDEDAARTFPARELRAQDLSGSRARSILHTVLFVGLLAAAWSPWHSMLEVSAPVWAAAVVAAVAVAVVDLTTVRTWPMYVLGGTVVAGTNVVRGDLPDALVVAGVLGAVAYGARRARQAQVRRWVALKRILEDPVLVQGRIERVRRTRTSGAAPVETLHLTVSSAEIPGRTWSVAFRPGARPGNEPEPEVGDHIAVFVSRSDPQVAVLRPVVASGRARPGAVAGPHPDGAAPPSHALVVPASGPDEARAFPHEAVRRYDVDAGNPAARRLLHGALFLPLALATFAPLPGNASGTLGLLAIVLAVVDLRTVATWQMYAAVGAVSVALGTLTGAAVPTTVFMAVAGSVGAYAAWHVQASRRRRWEGLRLLLDSPRLVEAVVVGSEKDSSGRTLDTLRHSAVLTLVCPELPGHRWTASLRLPHVGASPGVGDVLAMFAAAADPTVAVLRPVLPDAPPRSVPGAR